MSPVAHSHPAGFPPAVVSALARELAPLRRRARIGARIETERGYFVHARLDDRPLILGWTGDGRRSAEDGLRALLDRCAVGPLIVVGIAGALSPALRPQELVVAGDVRDAGGVAPAPDPELVRDALTAADASEGMIYSSESIVAAAADKARLWRRLGRPAGALVDLETAAWARVAAARGVPYLALRAVSDVAGVDLPLDFERFRDPRGRMRQRRVALEAARRPSLIAPLRRLQQQVDGCAERLASSVASCLVRESTEGSPGSPARASGQAEPARTPS